MSSLPALGIIASAALDVFVLISFACVNKAFTPIRNFFVPVRSTPSNTELVCFSFISVVLVCAEVNIAPPPPPFLTARAMSVPHYQYLNYH